MECLAPVGLQTSQAPELPSWLGRNVSQQRDGGLQRFTGISPWLPQAEELRSPEA